MLVLVVGRAYGRGRGLFVGFCEGPAEDSRAGEDDLRYYAVRLKTILDYVLKMCGVLLGRHTILYSDKRKRSDDSKCTSPSTQKVDEHRRCRRRSRTPGGSFRRMHDSDLPAAEASTTSPICDIKWFVPKCVRRSGAWTDQASTPAAVTGGCVAVRWTAS